MLGGSVAGLLAARVLSDHARSVVIVEPDPAVAAAVRPAPPDAPAPSRPGVPQDVQLHVLLGMGRLQLERWFPGIGAELLADGAVLCDGRRTHQYLDQRRRVVLPGHDLIGSTRPFLESRLRRRVLARDNVTVLPGRADGLRFGGGPHRRDVCGAYVRPLTGHGATGERLCLTGDLVVDATGRASRLGVWLEQGGWPEPALERVPIDLGYATALFARGDEPSGVRAVTSVTTPGPPGFPQRDSAAMAAVEGGRWMVVLANYAGRRPDGDPVEFRARCRATGIAPLHEATDDREPLGPVATHRVPDSRRRDFLGLDRFPAGLVAAGDAVASFNPLYAQGMTSAALHASCLAAFLRSGAPPDRPARGYFERLRVVVDAAWNLSALPDLALPHVPAPRSPRRWAAAWYGTLLNRATVTDAELNRRFLDVVNMRAHPRELTRPGTLWRVAAATRAARHG